MINQREYTKNSIRNISWGLIGQLIAYVLRFIIRIVFIQSLSAEYLGIEGLFTNIISVLSLSELGFGTAIVFSLYKPIIENNTDKILGLMNFYRKVYFVIGIVVLTMGLAISPFLDFFINEMPNIPNLQWYYCLFVFQSAFSYFFAYKRSLLIVNQQNYLVSIVHYIVEALFVCCEIIVLLSLREYVIYLLLTVVQVIVENLVISFLCDKYYPTIKKCRNYEIDRTTFLKIKSDVSSLVIHQFGSIVVNATDNIIISKYIGIIETGLYSNYSLIITAINGVLGQLFSGMTASLGQLNANEDEKHKQNVFWELFLLNHLIYGVVGLCAFFLISDVVFLAFGSNYILGQDVIAVLIVSFYLNGMRKTTLLYKSTMGIFKPDRYKAFVEAVINLLISVTLAKNIGIIGVFIGTVISCLLTSFWIEPLVVFKYGICDKARTYFSRYCFYLICILIALVPCFFICKMIVCTNIFILIMKGSIIVIVATLILVLPVIKTREFKSLLSRIKIIN